LNSFGSLVEREFEFGYQADFNGIFSGFGQLEFVFEFKNVEPGLPAFMFGFQIDLGKPPFSGAVTDAKTGHLLGFSGWLLGGAEFEVDFLFAVIDCRHIDVIGRAGMNAAAE
jgi:hypothetical protein